MSNSINLYFLGTVEAKVIEETPFPGMKVPLQVTGMKEWIEGRLSIRMGCFIYGQNVNFRTFDKFFGLKEFNT